MLRNWDSVAGDSDQCEMWVPQRPQKICCECAVGGLLLVYVSLMYVPMLQTAWREQWVGHAISEAGDYSMMVGWKRKIRENSKRLTGILWRENSPYAAVGFIGVEGCSEGLISRKRHPKIRILCVIVEEDFEFLPCSCF